LAEEQKHANAAAPLSKQITALSNDKAQLNADVQTCKDALAAAQATASQLQAALHQSQLAFDEKNTALQVFLSLLFFGPA
jgi:chromosome segregation ATPase